MKKLLTSHVVEKNICDGCVYKQVKVIFTENLINASGKDPLEAQLEKCCPFCRKPEPGSDQAALDQTLKSVELNDVGAMHALACSYSHGALGLPRDDSKALKYYLCAADLGFVPACHRVAVSFEKGIGVVQSLDKARHYYEFAAKGGSASSRHVLGCMEQEKGDMIMAYRHWLISASSGCKKSIDKILPGCQAGFVSKKEYSKSLRLHQKACEDMRSEDRDKIAPFFSTIIEGKSPCLP